MTCSLFTPPCYQLRESPHSPVCNFLNGRKDTLFAPEGVQTAFDKLTATYQKAGVPEKVCLRMYDTPHEFNTEMQTEAWAWLKRWV